MWRTTGDNSNRDGGFFDFNPRPPCGGRHDTVGAISIPSIFQSTSPVWRTTPDAHLSGKTLFPFQSTSPVWRTTPPMTTRRQSTLNFNPRPPCGGRLQVVYPFAIIFRISIHVPRVEDDTSDYNQPCGRDYFNPRPPCGGRLV